MKILFWDIETSMLIGGFFGLYKQDIPYSHIIQDWFIICAAWKWGHQRRINSISVLDDPRRFKEDHTDDYHVVSKLHQILQEADVVVAHNGDKFDFKKFMSRVVYHKLPPLDLPLFVDTLKEARKLSFTSNKLDDLGTHLDLGNKIATERGLWLGATLGEVPQIKKMRKYNRGDIPPLERLYERLKPYMKAHPNHNLFSDRPVCPNCGCNDLIISKYRPSSRISIKIQYQCKSCGKYCTDGKAKKVAELR